MYPGKFDYYRAGSVDEAIKLLQDNEDAKLLAGGHSLLPAMKLRLAMPTALIDIARISDLKGVSNSGGTLKIGALSTHASLADSDELKANCALIAETAGHIGDQQVRNKGTIGGSLAHADPASDLPAAVMAVDAVMHIAGPNGARQESAADFFVDLLATSLAEDEILTAIEVKALGDNTGSAYQKFEHPASGYAICGAAAVVELNADGTCKRAALCYNGVAAVPFSADAITDALAGKTLDDATIDEAVNANFSVEDPMSDVHASGPYRVELAKVYGRRALKLARGRAQG